MMAGMKLPRFQFRLRTLMIVVTLLAVACGGSAFIWRWYWARKNADALYAHWQDGNSITLLLGNDRLFFPRIIARRNWCLAECAVPFANRAAACRRYADAVFIEIKLAENESPPTPYAESLDRYKQEAEKWLVAGMATGESEQVPYGGK
jgi:hypothetical protein